MNENLPRVFLVRHGQTAWSVSGQHTGRSDIPLTEQGEKNAAGIKRCLAPFSFTQVFTSPSQRARRTCELAGYGAGVQIVPDLAEWDYGQYESIPTAEILQRRPGWQLFRDGCPGGESVADIGGRADRVLTWLRPIDGNALIFSSGHFLRVLAARWLGLETAAGRLLMLSTASVSVLGYEHDRNNPAIALWNHQPNND